MNMCMTQGYDNKVTSIKEFLLIIIVSSHPVLSRVLWLQIVLKIIIIIKNYGTAYCWGMVTKSNKKV